VYIVILNKITRFKVLCYVMGLHPKPAFIFFEDYYFISLRVLSECHFFFTVKKKRHQRKKPYPTLKLLYFRIAERLLCSAFNARNSGLKPLKQTGSLSAIRNITELSLKGATTRVCFASSQETDSFSFFVTGFGVGNPD